MNLKKILIILLTVLVVVLSGISIKISLTPSIEKTKEYVESLFGFHYTSISCENTKTNLIVTKSNFAIFSFSGANSKYYKKTLEEYTKNFKGFMLNISKKVDNPNRIILIWCEEPSILFYKGEYYGEAKGFLVFHKSSD